MATAVAPVRAGVGELLRGWRQRRRLSQLELANRAAVSARHLSFVETGRSRPSRELVLHLAEHLEVPLRERNALLLAAGYAPVYPQRSLDDEEMAPVREALDRVLAAYQEEWPLSDGWRERVPLHQLHLLLVHTALFGATWRSAVISAARRLG